MTEPIVFISHNRIKEGALEAYRDLLRENLPRIDESKPDTVVFLAYTDEDGRELHVVHVFPDADAMDRHFEGADERVANAMEFIQAGGYEIYGEPSEATLDAMRGFAERFGVPLTVRPSGLGGWVRPAAGAVAS